MCKCTPNLRTPFCGKPGCEPPPQRYDPHEELVMRAWRETIGWEILQVERFKEGVAKVYLRHAYGPGGQLKILYAADDILPPFVVPVPPAQITHRSDPRTGSFLGVEKS